MLFRVNDEVIVTSGDEKGKRGKVLKVDRAAGKIVVEGLNKVLKHVRRSQKNPQGGRLSKEMPLDASNCMLVCPKTGQPTRIGVRYAADGSKERFAKKSGASLGQVAPAKSRYARKG